MTYADVVVSAAGCQTALALGLEMGRVDGGILVMPIDDCRLALHGGIRLRWPRLPASRWHVLCLRLVEVSASKLDPRRSWRGLSRQRRSRAAQRSAVMEDDEL